MMPEPQSKIGDPGRRRTCWRQMDVLRAINAAKQAGLQDYRVEVAPDGTVSIVVGAPAGSEKRKRRKLNPPAML
ncbi:hypothetical protein FHS61_000174 [Altererythrobacter atlanticus]|nr:hypothetical protein [Croceibacterium atlanticum]MBB5731181.1 hypothetical protein [Croceibacterium atlanticum]